MVPVADDFVARYGCPFLYAECRIYYGSVLTAKGRWSDAEGDVWIWHLLGVGALGVSVAPTFTERMTFREPSSIHYEHHLPDGRTERAGANGVYELEERADGCTRLSIDITLCVELPLPRLSRRAVERVMATTMRRTGDRFAVNLYRHLGND